MEPEQIPIRWQNKQKILMRLGSDSRMSHETNNPIV